MSSPLAPLTVALKWGSLVVLFLAISAATWAAAADSSSLAFRYTNRYTASLEQRLRPMFIFTRGRTILIGQLACVFAVTSVHLVVEIPGFWVLLIVAGALPLVYISRLQRERVLAVEEQLDSFLLAIANALKTTPSIGAAFESVVYVIQNPLRLEVELALKEMKVGSSLEQALMHLAARVGSRQLDSALSAILIGRQVGGNLPKVLETTASSLREMRRLEGVVRTKTAEGRTQLIVIALMPFAIVVGLNAMWPGYFLPLTQSVTGYMIVAAVCIAWVAAIVLATRILAVDI